jgi:DNA-binding transcriptional LysR family regulator
MLRQCYETALAAKMVAASIRNGEAAPLSMAITRTVALSHFTPMLQQLSRAFPGLQLKLRRGSGNEVAEFLKSGAAELAIAGPLNKTWSRLDELPLFEEPYGLIVSPTHRLAGKNIAEFNDLASENLLINTGCEMIEELRACLEANGILDAATYQVTTHEDVLALLRADLGVAIIPVGAVETNGLCNIPLKQFDLARRVSVYTVAGRQRAIGCATLFNMLRAADWGFDTGRRPYR